MNVPLIGAPPSPDVYGVVRANQHHVSSMKNIDAGLINKIAEGNFGYDRTIPRYNKNKSVGWNAN